MQQRLNESLKPCPNCAEAIGPTAVYCHFCQRGLSEPEFKKCPFCAEMIKQNAKRCRFCKLDLFDQENSGNTIRLTLPNNE